MRHFVDSASVPCTTQTPNHTQTPHSTTPRCMASSVSSSFTTLGYGYGKLVGGWKRPRWKRPRPSDDTPMHDPQVILPMLTVRVWVWFATLNLWTPYCIPSGTQAKKKLVWTRPLLLQLLPRAKVTSQPDAVAGVIHLHMILIDCAF